MYQNSMTTDPMMSVLTSILHQCVLSANTDHYDDIYYISFEHKEVCLGACQSIYTEQSFHENFRNVETFPGPVKRGRLVETGELYLKYNDDFDKNGQRCDDNIEFDHDVYRYKWIPYRVFQGPYPQFNGYYLYEFEYKVEFQMSPIPTKNTLHVHNANLANPLTLPNVSNPPGRPWCHEDYNPPLYTFRYTSDDKVRLHSKRQSAEHIYKRMNDALRAERRRRRRRDPGFEDRMFERYDVWENYGPYETMYRKGKRYFHDEAF